MILDIIIAGITAADSEIPIPTEIKTIREAGSETSSNNRITTRDRRTAADLETAMATPTTPEADSEITIVRRTISRITPPDQEADSEDNNSKLRKRTANTVRFSFLYSNFASSFSDNKLWNFINIKAQGTTL